MSLSYSNLPVYVGEADASTVTENTAYVAATQANVLFTATANAKRPLGSAVDSTDQFKVTNPLGVNVSFSCFLDPFTSGFAFLETANQASFFPIKVGDNLYKSCYLSQYSVSIAPYVPVVLSAQFVSLDAASGQQISGDNTLYGIGGIIPFDPDDIAYGHTCTISNLNTVVGNVQSEINYTKQFSRTPVYTLGSVNAGSMLLDGVESQMSITSTGLNNLIDFSGDKLGSTITVNMLNIDSSSTIPALSMAAGATVLTEGYDVKGGDTLSVSATIKEINL